MAYLSRREDQRERLWQLRLAPVVFGGPGGKPSVMTAFSVMLGDDCVTGPSILSGEGCWVYALVGRSGDDVAIVRYSVVDAMRPLDLAGCEEGSRFDLDQPRTMNLALE